MYKRQIVVRAVSKMPLKIVSSIFAVSFLVGKNHRLIGSAVFGEGCFEQPQF